ncbi:hypothetical protein EDM56_22235 [Brevibacillus fluminis]|uniref:GNAT family N-acetyltransferase n=1 Tax=Brevibacillus fluminis TaxID=511487 RepID=A0A3M8D5M0_9BACL|nr:hypothetical protein [Brevibacillus fluminis]RNB83386.1 hypothetical protein EDM56_22235 [Brevibacillus fluminis]
MSCTFSACASEMDYQNYLEFLLEHYRDLHLPYPFPVSLSFIASPVLMQQGSILCFDESEDRNIGALGYILGTGENHYQDTHVVQIQAVYLLEPYRSHTVFRKGLQFFTDHIVKQHEVSEIRFFAPADDKLHRLLTKVSERIATRETDSGPLNEYRAAFSEWLAKVARFSG